MVPRGPPSTAHHGSKLNFLIRPSSVGHETTSQQLPVFCAQDIPRACCFAGGRFALRFKSYCSLEPVSEVLPLWDLCWVWPRTNALKVGGRGPGRAELGSEPWP